MQTPANGPTCEHGAPVGTHAKHESARRGVRSSLYKYTDARIGRFTSTTPGHSSPRIRISFFVPLTDVNCVPKRTAAAARAPAVAFGVPGLCATDVAALEALVALHPTFVDDAVVVDGFMAALTSVQVGIDARLGLSAREGVRVAIWAEVPTARAASVVRPDGFTQIHVTAFADNTVVILAVLVVVIGDQMAVGTLQTSEIGRGFVLGGCLFYA